MLYFFIFLFQSLIGNFFQNPLKDVNQLRNNISHIISNKKAKVCIAIMSGDGKDTLSINGNTKCPLQSVFKFHISLAILDLVDKGKLSLDKKVEIRKEQLLPDLWSPLREANPEGGRFTISELIKYAVAQSDNVACDALLRVIGSPKAVQKYLAKKGIIDLGIAINEEVMQAKYENMYKNWSTANASNMVLRKFYENKTSLLSQTSYDFIWQTMTDTQTGLKRLKGLLPEGTKVAHKTGTSGTSPNGVVGAINDIGVVFLPNGKYYYISVFVTESKEKNETNELIIAQIAQASFDYFGSR
jgi:beta-lactamase class A